MTPLAAIRDELGVSRSTVATDLDIEYSHLYRIERGEAQASPAVARRLAEYFEHAVTRDQILFPDLYETDQKKPARSVRVAGTKKPVKRAI